MTATERKKRLFQLTDNQFARKKIVVTKEKFLRNRCCSLHSFILLVKNMVDESILKKYCILIPVKNRFECIEKWNNTQC